MEKITRIEKVKRIMNERRVCYWTASSCLDADYFYKLNTYTVTIGESFSYDLNDIDENLYHNLICMIASYHTVLFSLEWCVIHHSEELHFPCYTYHKAYEKCLSGKDVYDELLHLPNDSHVRVIKMYDVIRKEVIPCVKITKLIEEDKYME